MIRRVIAVWIVCLILEDLWASLSHACSKPVAAVMETWTKQMGFPVLSVTAEQVCGQCATLTVISSAQAVFYFLWSLLYSTKLQGETLQVQAIKDLGTL